MGPEAAAPIAEIGARSEEKAWDDPGVETPDPVWRRRLLIEALTLVAAPAPAQVAWLEMHGVGADEIALDFEHAFLLAERLAEEGLIHHGALPGLRVIDVVFDEMTSGETADRWTVEALFQDAGWSRARGLAQWILAGEGISSSEV